LAGLGLAFLILPMVGLFVRSPWRRLPSLLDEETSRQALRLSLYSATMATVVSLLLGIPLAWALVRLDLPGLALIRAFVTVPLVLPPVVGGVALLLAFGRRGLIGGPIYDHTGWSLPFTTTAVIVAEAFVAMPFLVVTVEGALRAADRRYEEAASTLGADRLTVLRRVTLPMILPSVAAGAVLSWARALGEFGATITFAGSFPGRTQTLPLAVYLELEDDPSAAFALSLVLLLASVIVLVVLRGRWLSAIIS
jgi:molybdate transport system permease protein